jgi:hypothetical protein
VNGWLLTRLFRSQRGMAVLLHAVFQIALGTMSSLPLITGADRPEVFFNLQLRMASIVILAVAPVFGALLDAPEPRTCGEAADGR